MNNMLKQYLNDKLRVVYSNLNVALKEYNIILKNKNVAHKELLVLEQHLSAEESLFPHWEDFKNDKLTFDIYSDIMLLKADICKKQLDVLELTKEIIFKRAEVEELKQGVISVKVDLHWIEDDDDYIN